MRTVMRAAVVAALGAGVVLVGAGSASAAAAPEASCVGIIVSNLASAGALDVDDFKALAASEGVRFGEFVSTGARLHEGDLASCLP